MEFTLLVKPLRKLADKILMIEIHCPIRTLLLKKTDTMMVVPCTLKTESGLSRNCLFFSQNRKEEE
mgnify:CR=1 FL=1